MDKFDELKKKYQSGERKLIPTNHPQPERRKRFSALTEKLKKEGCFQQKEVDADTSKAIQRYSADGNPFVGLTDEVEIDRLTNYIIDAKRNDLIHRGYATYTAFEEAKKYVDKLKEEARRETKSADELSDGED